MGIHTTDNLIQHFISVLISLFHFDSEHWPYLPVLLQSSQSLHAYEAEVPHHQWTGQSSFLLAVALARSSSSLSVPSHVEVAAMEVRYLFLPSTDHTWGHLETWTIRTFTNNLQGLKKSLYKDYRFFFFALVNVFFMLKYISLLKLLKQLKCMAMMNICMCFKNQVLLDAASRIIFFTYTEVSLVNYLCFQILLMKFATVLQIPQQAFVWLV